MTTQLLNYGQLQFYSEGGETMSFGRALDDKANPFFQVDPLITIEYFEILKGRTYRDPERSLMLAVLEDAIMCLEKYAPFGARGNQRLYDEARDWILSDDRDWLFSLTTCVKPWGCMPATCAAV